MLCRVIFSTPQRKAFCKPLKTLFLLKIRTMKKIYILLAAIILIAGCDDGDMTFREFNFTDNISPVQCTLNKSTIYRINGSEALVLNLAESLFLNVESAKDANGNYIATEVPVGSNSYSMFYRTYSGTPNNATFCGSSGSPNITEQYTGNGRIGIITSPITDSNGKVTGYAHQLNIISATFSKGDQEVTIIDQLLGSFTTQLDITFDFGNETDVPTPANLVRRCDNGTLFKVNGTETLQLQIPASYFTSTEAERVIDINATNNNASNDDNIVLYFVEYGATIGTNNRAVCAPLVTDPRPVKTWIVSGGNIVISYAQDVDGVFKHTIRFRNLVLRNNDSSAEIYRPISNGTDGFWFGFYPI
jgi:hypothetical protein